MRRNLPSIVPFLLATFGSFMILLAGDMPLFEWKISRLVTDFPSTYEVRVDPSPWTAYFGDSLEDGLFIFRNVWVKREGQACSVRDLSIDVQRIKDYDTEGLLNLSMDNLVRLRGWSMIIVLLSVLYIWWFTIWHEREAGCFLALFFTGIAVVIYLNLSELTRSIASPFRLVFSRSDLGRMACNGSVTFTAELVRIYYEAPIVLFVATLLGVGAIVVMLLQIRKAIIDRKASAQSVVG